ncbi:MAG: efflux RND transporter permease subunit [Burkholderiales bacterium]
MIAGVVKNSIKHAGVVVAIAVTLVLYGIYTVSRANLDVFPEFSPSQVVLQIEAPGYPSELVEALVTQPIENSLMGIPNLKNIRSQSIPGLAVVTVIFEDGTDVYVNRQVVGERIASLGPQMPAGVNPPTMTPLTSSASTVLGVGVTSDERTLGDLRSLVDWTIRPHLLAVNGVAEVNVFGGNVNQWQIQIDPERLRRAELSIDDVVSSLKNYGHSPGSGFIKTPNQHLIIQADAGASTLDDLRQVVIGRLDGAWLRVRDVANVLEAPAHSIGSAAINAKPGVFLMVQGQLGANTHAVTRDLEKAMEELKPLIEKESVVLHPNLFRPANFIETAVRNVQRDVLIGAALVISILFLFLYNARTAVICAVAMPVSLLSAVIVLDYFGVALNVMVIGGLAIALGEVVDDAIIDTENIFRRLRLNSEAVNKLPISQVVLNASVEVRSSVVYATFIVVLAFVPLLTLSGIAGKLFAPLGLAYIFAILASLVTAVTLTPALCYLLLSRIKLSSEDPPAVAFLRPKYEVVLRWFEKRFARNLFVVFLVVVSGISVFPLFSGEFIPALREGHYIAHMTAVPGTSESESLRIGNKVSKALGSIDGVQSVVQWVGRSKNGADTFGTHYSEFEIEIGALGGDEQARVLSDIRAVLSGESFGNFPGLSFGVNTFLTERIEETITGFAAPFVVTIYGSDLDSLDRDAIRVANAINRVPGAEDVQIQAPPGTPQLMVKLRQARLSSVGLTPVEVVEALGVAYDGKVVGQVHRGNQVTDVVVILAEEERNNVNSLNRLELRNDLGQVVQLSEVAEVQVVGGRYKVLHSGGRRVQTVTAKYAGRDLSKFEATAKNIILDEVTLSDGNYLSFSGTAESEREAKVDLVVHSLLAGIGVFLLLYLAFNQFHNMVLTFLNLPFALVGGVIAVIFSGGWLSLGSLVGFVTLFGITLRNSIMLVSHYHYLVEEEGIPWNFDTVLRGAGERLPSILMTALVTGLGLMPLALGSGEPGREIEGPMATIIVGGLATSTVLNLLVLPTILFHFGRFNPRDKVTI